jgi:hypothetical protein
MLRRIFPRQVRPWKIGSRRGCTATRWIFTTQISTAWIRSLLSHQSPQLLYECETENWKVQASAIAVAPRILAQRLAPCRIKKGQKSLSSRLGVSILLKEAFKWTLILGSRSAAQPTSVGRRFAPRLPRKRAFASHISIQVVHTNAIMIQLLM